MKAQSILIRTLKHQIASCLKLIELKVRSAVLRLLDLEEKLREELKKAMMEVSPYKFVKLIQDEWNATQGTEWHAQACGFVKAKIWDKKDGEIRLYVGKGYLRYDIQQKTHTFHGLQYDFHEKLELVIKEIAATYKVSDTVTNNVANNVGCWHDEDGNIVDPVLQPADAVAFY